MKDILNGARAAKICIALFSCFSSLSYAQDTPAPLGAGIRPTNWNDTYIGFRYGNDFHFPGIPDKVTQRIGYLTSTGGFKYGSYAFIVEHLVSDAANPEANGPGGAQEVYSIGRVELSAEKILGRSVGQGIVRDFGLTTGYEFNAKNDAFGARARMLVLGPTIDFAVPRGFWNATLGVRTENNHNGITRQDVDFETAWHFESAWLTPFSMGDAPFLFRGFASVTGPKGKDGFGADTKTEVLTRISLLADLGALSGHPRALYAGIGYEYWHNMFGTPESEAPGTQRSAPMVMAEVHF